MTCLEETERVPGARGREPGEVWGPAAAAVGAVAAADKAAELVEDKAAQPVAEPAVAAPVHRENAYAPSAA